MAVATLPIARPAPASGMPPMRYRTTYIRDVARRRGIRLPWLAHEMGISRSYLTMILNGQRAITPRVVEAACRALALPEQVLFADPIERGERP